MDTLARRRTLGIRHHRQFEMIEVHTVVIQADQLVAAEDNASLKHQPDAMQAVPLFDQR
ncbi:hypothetical protein D3C81_2086020 [compost metagenome]